MDLQCDAIFLYFLSFMLFIYRMNGKTISDNFFSVSQIQYLRAALCYILEETQMKMLQGNKNFQFMSKLGSILCKYGMNEAPCTTLPSSKKFFFIRASKFIFIMKTFNGINRTRESRKFAWNLNTVFIILIILPLPFLLTLNILFCKNLFKNFFLITWRSICT